VVTHFQIYYRISKSLQLEKSLKRLIMLLKNQEKTGWCGYLKVMERKISEVKNTSFEYRKIIRLN